MGTSKHPTDGAASTAPAQLLERAAAAAYGATRTPFDAQAFHLVSLDDRECLTPEDLEQLTGWMRRQPCPVIGLGERGGASEVADACDLVMSDREGLATVVAHIDRAPLAAMTLVQVLRETSAMSPGSALTLESLAYSALQAGPEFRRWSADHPPAPERIARDDGPPVQIERDGARLMLRFNRPSSRNAMTVEMRDALVEAFELAAADSSIKAVTVDAAGACFSVGGAVEEFGTAPDPVSAHAVRSVRLPAAALLRIRAASHFHVHGACIGAGIELPAFADRLTASQDAFFQLPEIRFGLIPGAGGCVSLPRRIGRQRTAYLALSARRINAAKALRWGLIDAIEDRA